MSQKFEIHTSYKAKERAKCLQDDNNVTLQSADEL